MLPRLTIGKEMDRFLASSGYKTGGIDKIMPSIKHKEPTRMHREIGFVIGSVSVKGGWNSCISVSAICGMVEKIRKS